MQYLASWMGGCTSTYCTWTGVHTAQCTWIEVHTGQYTWIGGHIAHCTLNNVHYALHTAHCTLHSAQCILHHSVHADHQEMASNSTSSRQYPWHHFRVPPPLITSSARVSHGHCQCHLKTQPIQPVAKLQWMVHWTVHSASVSFSQCSAQCECIGQHWSALVSAVHSTVSALVSFGQREVVQ